METGETLYLIFDYLREHASSLNAVNVLREELEQHGMFQEAVNWKGEVKKATLSSMEKKFGRNRQMDYILANLKNHTVLGRPIVSQRGAQSTVKERRDAIRGLIRVMEKKQMLGAQNEQYKNALEMGLLAPRRYARKNQLFRLASRQIGVNMERMQHTYIYSRYRILKSLHGHLDHAAYCVVFGDYGRVIITGSDDRLVKLWSATTGDLLYTLRGHTGNITDLAVDRNQHLVATSSEDKTIRVWEIQSGFPIAVLSGHTSIINNVRFHPTKNVVIGASDDGTCRVWVLPAVQVPFKMNETKTQTVLRLSLQNAYAREILPDALMNHFTGQTARKSKVQALAISPCGQFFVTGAEDGVGRVWCTEGNRQDNAEEFNSPNLSVPIAYLRGHEASITSVSYNRKGDKIITASIKDGTARVWSWEQRYENVVLSCLECQASKLIRARRKRKMKIPSVDTVAWSADDHRIITLHSVLPDREPTTSDWLQRINVWNPENGELLRTLHATGDLGHRNAAFVLSMHPTDWKLIITAGYDGRIILWDIDAGKILRKFVNFEVIQEQPQICPLLDGCFSPDGSKIVFTDRVGRLSIFGTGSGDAYATAPTEQYFSTDYAGIDLDASQNAVDRDTQIAPHLLTNHVLTDANRIPYRYQPPLYSAVQNTVEQYESYRKLRIQQAQNTKPESGGIAEDEEFIDFPSAATSLLDLDLFADGGHIDDDPAPISDVVTPIDVVSTQNNNRRRRRAAPWSDGVDDRDTSILTLEISSDEDDDEDFQQPRNLPAVEVETNNDHEMDEGSDQSSSTLDSFDESEGSNDDAEVDEVRQPRRASKRRRRRTIRGVSLAASDIGDVLDISDNESDFESSKKRRINLRSGKAKRPKYVIESSDDEADCEGNDDDDEEVNLGKLVVFDTSTTYSKLYDAESIIKCGFCQQGSIEPTLPLPPKLLGHHPILFGNTRIFVHDLCALNSPNVIHEDDQFYNIVQEIKNGVCCDTCQQPGATLRCKKLRCRRRLHYPCATLSDSELEVYCQQHQPTSSSIVKSTAPFDTYKRDWLQKDSHERYEDYIPQCGDYVVYFPQGHEMHCTLLGLPLPHLPPEIQGCHATLCTITQIEYAFPTGIEAAVSNSIICKLGLNRLSVAKNEEILPTIPENGVDSSMYFEACKDDAIIFTIAYGSRNVPDYLVLEDKFLTSLGYQWQNGLEILVPFGNDNASNEPKIEMYHGKIVDIVPKQAIFPLSPWEGLIITFDNDDEITRLSPWECVPDGTFDPPTIQQGKHDNAIQDEKKSAILESLREILDMPEAEGFLEPATDAPQYLSVIANPIDLSLIHRRIENDYYRQIEALIADVNLIACNCAMYNVPNSEIINDATFVQNRILMAIDTQYPGTLNELPYIDETNNAMDASIIEALSEIDDELLHFTCNLDSAALYSILFEVHADMMASDVDLFFHHPVTESVAPGYHDTITQPMDFSTMRSNLDEYKSLQEYIVDLALVFSNAIAYNLQGSPIYTAAKNLSSIFRTKLNQAIETHKAKRTNIEQTRRSNPRRNATRRPATPPQSPVPCRRRSSRRKTVHRMLD